LYHDVCVGTTTPRSAPPPPPSSSSFWSCLLSFCWCTGSLLFF
jgi:hypothetical protein